MRLGQQKVFCGDCVEVLRDTVIPETDLVIADPPYWKVVGEKVGLSMENRS